MDKNLRVNRIFRILAGIYLLYLSTSLWRELDTSSNKTVGIVFIILFAIVGIVLLILSSRDLIRMKNESTEETEEISEESTEESTEETMEESMEETMGEITEETIEESTKEIADTPMDKMN